MLTFFFSLSVGFYVGLMCGLIVVLLVAVYSREQVETVVTETPAAAVAPRMVDLFHADATSYGTN
jgi:Mg/Co/Ni transporter MgtE